jgi:hypothetical protein
MRKTQCGGRVRARKELRFKNLSVLNYLLHGETTVSPTPFVLWSSSKKIFVLLSINFGISRRTQCGGRVRAPK